MTEKIEKQRLRKKMISLLNSVSAEEKAAIELKLEENLFRSSEWKSAKRIGVTLSQGFEWNTLGIIKKAWEEGKTVCAPKCVPEDRKSVV